MLSYVRVIRLQKQLTNQRQTTRKQNYNKLISQFSFQCRYSPKSTVRTVHVQHKISRHTLASSNYLSVKDLTSNHMINGRFSLSLYVGKSTEYLSAVEVAMFDVVVIPVLLRYRTDLVRLSFSRKNIEGFYDSLSTESVGVSW